jgi:hypothetical protein
MDDHICTPESCPDGANYFVTAIDGPTFYYMAGPYKTHRAALDQVEPARKIACDRDGKGHFMGWGTVKSSRTEQAPHQGCSLKLGVADG